MALGEDTPTIAGRPIKPRTVDISESLLFEKSVKETTAGLFPNGIVTRQVKDLAVHGRPELIPPLRFLGPSVSAGYSTSCSATWACDFHLWKKNLEWRWLCSSFPAYRKQTALPGASQEVPLGRVEEKEEMNPGRFSQLQAQG